MWYIYTIEYYSAIRKDKTLPFVTTWMGLETIMLNEIKSEKTRTICFHSYVRYKSKTHRHRQQCGGYQRKWGGSGGVEEA